MASDLIPQVCRTAKSPGFLIYHYDSAKQSQFIFSPPRTLRSRRKRRKSTQINYMQGLVYKTFSAVSLDCARDSVCGPGGQYELCKTKPIGGC
jgi:hypothetical protein